MSIVNEAADGITLFSLLLLLLLVHVPKSLHLSAMDGWVYLVIISVLAVGFSFKFFFLVFQYCLNFYNLNNLLYYAGSYSYFYINTFFVNVSIINVSIWVFGIFMVKLWILSLLRFKNFYLDSICLPDTFIANTFLSNGFWFL